MGDQEDGGQGALHLEVVALLEEEQGLEYDMETATKENSNHSEVCPENAGKPQLQKAEGDAGAL